MRRDSAAQDVSFPFATDAPTDRRIVQSDCPPDLGQAVAVLEVRAADRMVAGRPAAQRAGMGSSGEGVRDSGELSPLQREDAHLNR